MDSCNDVLVSVICATYNHEKFVELSIISAIMQNTNFKYEILVGEDCSKDNSRAILRDLEARFSEKIKVFYREKNIGPTKNFNDLYNRAKGKYVVVLETDDFWIDQFKLQKQFDFLEEHQDYLAVSHHCIMVDENNQCLGIRFPECSNPEYTLREFRKGLFPGQTTTIMFKNYYKDDCGFDTSITTNEKYCIGPGDFRRAFMLVSNGKVKCLPETMSAYRFVNKSGSSFTATQDHDIIKKYEYRKVFVEYAIERVKKKNSIWSAEYLLIRDMEIYTHKYNSIELQKLTKSIRSSLKHPILCYSRFGLFLIGYFFRKVLKIPETYKHSNIVGEQRVIDSYLNSTIKMGDYHAENK